MENRNELEQLKMQVADLSKRLARLERLEHALCGELLGELIGEMGEVPDIPQKKDREPDDYTIFEHALDDDAFLDKVLESQEQKQSRIQEQMVPDELQEELSGEILDDPSDSGVITLDTLDAEKSLSNDLDDLGDEINRLFS